MSKNHDTEKVIVKQVNLGCMILALLLTVLVVFAYSTLLSADLEIGGVSFGADISEDIEMMFEGEDEDAGHILAVLLSTVCIVMTFVMFINVIRVVIGWFGFIGKKDSRKMALKLAKHAKISFGSLATAIVVHLLAAADDGKIIEQGKTVMILAAVAIIVTYAAVRYYRWFVVDKVSYKFYVFQIVKDVMFFAMPIVLMTIIPAKPIGDIIASMSVLTTQLSNTPYIMAESMAQLFTGWLGFVMILAFMDVVGKTMKYLPFDNYKRSAASRLAKNYITVIIAPVIFMLIGAFATVMSATKGTFDPDMFVDSLMGYIAPVVKMIVLAVAAGIVAKVGTEDDYKDYKIAVAPVEEAPVEEAPVEEAPAEEQEPTEEDAEEAPAEEEVSEETIEE